QAVDGTGQQPPWHRSRLQRQFESRPALFRGFFGGLHQDATQRRWGKQKLGHFEDARLAGDGFGESVENWWGRRRGTRKFKNPCAGFPHIQMVRSISSRLDRLLWLRNSQSVLHRNREPIVVCAGGGFDRGRVSGP